MEAAFFDLDKTVIARASMVAFGRPFQRAGLLSRWLVVRALYAQLVFQYLGADEQRMAKMREAVLRVSRGWDQAHISQIVRETLDEVIEPIVYAEALDLIRFHQAEGRRVFIVSASPEEIVAPLSQYLGVDEAIATRALLDDEGRYTGEVEFYSYGPHKAEAMRRVAAQQGIDLSASYAYSDSATDLPMLEIVGHPVVVNPDRELARVARDRGWEVRQFRHGVPLRERVTMPPPGRTAAGVASVALVLGGLAVGWWLLRRRTLRPAEIAGRADQLRQAARGLEASVRSTGSAIRRPAASSPQRQQGRRRR